MRFPVARYRTRARNCLTVRNLPTISLVWKIDTVGSSGRIQPMDISMYKGQGGLHESAIPTWNDMSFVTKGAETPLVPFIASAFVASREVPLLGFLECFQ